MAVEAVPAAEGAVADAGAARTAKAAKSKPGTRTTSKGTTIVRGSGGSKVSTSREGQRAMPKPEPAPEPEPAGKSRRQRASEFGQRHVPREPIHRTNYQPIILMEFVACILLTAITPIATKKDTQGLSPYAGKDIVKLSAITVLYLILAMLSVGGPKTGRFAAWFGGLILLADGLYEAGNIVRDLRLVSGAGAATPASGAPAPGPGGILPTPSGTQPVLGET